MKSKLYLALLLSFIFNLLSSQVPQGFNYQAILRDDGTNQPIVSQPVLIRITIEDGIGTHLYQETHSLSTDEFGIVSIIIGQGTPWGTSGFNEIDWNDEPLQLKTEVQYPVGGSYTVMGTAPLMSVPYAMVADSLGGPLKNLKVKGSASTPDTEALFEVKNTSGQTIFAVYNEGVRIYVNDVDAKGAKGGFAIGGFGMGKTIPHQYMFISGDSVRFNIDNGDEDKGPKGGFAIGGFGTVKGLTQKYLMVSNDSVRIYVDNKETDKGPKGGFAIGGYGTDKGEPQKLLTVSNDSVRIYINDGAKGPKGGFAIGGFGTNKGFKTGFLNVTPDSTRIYVNEPSTGDDIPGFSVGERAPISNKLNDYLNLGKYSSKIFSKAQFSTVKEFTSWNLIVDNFPTVDTIKLFKAGFAELSMTIPYREYGTGDDAKFEINTSAYTKGLPEKLVSIGLQNTLVGSGSGIHIDGANNILMGNYSEGGSAHSLLLCGDDNIILGSDFNVDGWYDDLLPDCGLGVKNNNVLIGSGMRITGENNVCIGTNAGSARDLGESNKLYIENTNADKDGALIYGEFDSDKLKLNARVTVRDALTLAPRSSPPSGPAEGEIYYDSDDHMLYVWNSTEWKACW